MPDDVRSLRESHVLNDLQECKKRRGVAAYEAARHVSTLQSLADDRFGGDVSKLLTTALDSLRMRGRIEPPNAKSNRMAPYGREWAAFLEVVLNIARADRDLSDRIEHLNIPRGISEYYNTWTTTSSTVRTQITKHGLTLLARVIVGNDERNVSAGIVRAKAAPAQRIRTVTRELISRHGLNHDQWADALSGQYFLTLLARRLGMTSREDYKEMLNRFLASFTYRLDDTLILNERHILVTPQEAERMRECMIREDGADPFFGAQTRHSAENIDISAMHRNYLYGLVLGIAADGDSRVLATVRSLAFGNLLGTSAASSTPVDDDGGWVPYRVPWITARILTSLALLAESDLSNGHEPVTRRAAQSLVERVAESGVWRSGVGEWVTLWESTGLCLEALINHGDPVHGEVIAAVAERLRETTDEWRVSPSFEDAEASNQTLAACIVSATLLLASRSSITTFELPDDEVLQQQEFLADSLTYVAETGPTQTRQFCTIPQVMYYAALAVEEDQ